MVTAGANQAFVNLVLALLDPQDAVVLFAPYYFNHMMALQVSILQVWLQLCIFVFDIRNFDWQTLHRMIMAANWKVGVIILFKLCLETVYMNASQSAELAIKASSSHDSEVWDLLTEPYLPASEKAIQ